MKKYVTGVLLSVWFLVVSSMATAMEVAPFVGETGISGVKLSMYTSIDPRIGPPDLGWFGGADVYTNSQDSGIDVFVRHYLESDVYYSLGVGRTQDLNNTVWVEASYANWWFRLTRQQNPVTQVTEQTTCNTEVEPWHQREHREPECTTSITSDQVTSHENYLWFGYSFQF